MEIISDFILFLTRSYRGRSVHLLNLNQSVFVIWWETQHSLFSETPYFSPIKYFCVTCVSNISNNQYLIQFTSRFMSLCLSFHSQNVLIISPLSRCFCSAWVRLEITWSLRDIDFSYVARSSLRAFISSRSLVFSDACL